jgi:uncharacterized phage protein (TIGR02220 family)
MIKKLYAITDWDKLYETHQTKILKNLRWVPVKNNWDGDSYSELMAQPDASTMFAAFILLAEVASRCSPRGLLIRTDGTPHDSRSLASRTRANPEWFEQSFGYLTDAAKWLTAWDVTGPIIYTPKKEVFSFQPDCLIITAGNPALVPAAVPALVPAAVPAATAGNPALVPALSGGEGKEGKGIEGNESSTMSLGLDSASESPVEGSAKFRRSKILPLAKIILLHLNAATGRTYQDIDANTSAIACRLEEVILDTEGVKKMIDRQCALWKGDEKMDQYLRVSTLFNKTKFHEYYSARDLPTQPNGRTTNHEEGF